MLRHTKRIFNVNKLYSNLRNISYVQGQEPEPKIREYFYYIDHEGMLFLDDAKMKNFTSCFKEKKFLKFFFNRIRINETARYRDEFPFMSLCGRERNFIRCDDLPIVYTHLLRNINGSDKLSYANTGDLLTVDFQPHMIYMDPQTGRIYHPADEKMGNIGLISSRLGIELSQYFEFRNGEENQPTHFIWNGKCIQLDTKWVKNTIKSEYFIK